VTQRKIGPFTFRFDGEETLPHEVGDEIIWTCPVTGTSFHMERMADDHFWFCLLVKEKPSDEGKALHCNLTAGEGHRLQLTLQEVEGESE
jgi:hypothetical protein